MTKLSAKFVNGDGDKLTVWAQEGKKGINLAVSHRAAGQPAQTGCRSTVATEAEATRAFEALKKDAIAKGWIEKAKKDRNAFTSEPLATSAPADVKSKKANRTAA